LEYAQWRFNTSPKKHHEKHWRQIIKRIKKTLDSFSSEET